MKPEKKKSRRWGWKRIIWVSLLLLPVIGFTPLWFDEPEPLTNRDSGETMQAVVRHEYGTADRLRLERLRDEGKVQAGQTELIVGASGGVGTYAVQIAKSYGADRVIDYTQEDFTEGNARYDVVMVLNGLIDGGKFRSMIGRNYTLAEVPEAIHYVEEGHARGKVIIAVEPAPES